MKRTTRSTFLSAAGATPIAGCAGARYAPHAKWISTGTKLIVGAYQDPGTVNRFGIATLDVSTLVGA